MWMISETFRFCDINVTFWLFHCGSFLECFNPLVQLPRSLYEGSRNTLCYITNSASICSPPNTWLTSPWPLTLYLLWLTKCIKCSFLEVRRQLFKPAWASEFRFSRFCQKNCPLWLVSPWLLALCFFHFKKYIGVPSLKPDTIER